MSEAKSGRQISNGNKYFKKISNNYLLNQNGLGEGVDTYFTLSFSYDFDANENDEVYFAHTIPYTYTDLNQ